MKQNNQSFNYRFPVWLTVIFFTLFSIPILIVYNNILIAKIVGVITVVLTSIAIRYWMRIARLKSGTSSRVLLTNNDLFDMKRKYSFLKEMTNTDFIALRDRVGVVLSRCKFIDELGNHYSKEESIHLSLYIGIDNHLEMILNNDVIFMNSETKLIKQENNCVVFFYPIRILMQDDLLFSSKHETLKQVISNLEFVQYIKKSSI